MNASRNMGETNSDEVRESIMQQIMSCGVAVYPDFEIPGEMERTWAYLRSARALGYGEVFTSLHIPERDVSGVLGELAALGEFVHRCGMEFTLDASGNVMNGFLDDPEKFALLRKIPMDWLRMDFGFNPESIRRMVGMLSLKGLMCNASMLSAEEVRELVRMTEAWDGLKLRAHHNFYPRPETGLSMEFLCAKSKPYLPYDIPVTACIPGFQNPRQPLFAGLPTVERHRRMCAGDAAAELKKTGLISSVLIGDPFAGEGELEEVAEVCLGKPVTLRVQTEAEISEQERKILFGGLHHTRPDCPETALRSQSSRGMAAIGTAILPRENGGRRRFDITIDNEKYCRYSGELQLLLQDLPADPRVNVAAHVLPEDWGKVCRILPGTDFRLTEES